MWGMFQAIQYCGYSSVGRAGGFHPPSFSAGSNPVSRSKLGRAHPLNHRLVHVKVVREPIIAKPADSSAGFFMLMRRPRRFHAKVTRTLKYALTLKRK